MNGNSGVFDIYKYRNCFGDYVDVKSREIIKNTVENPFFTIIIPTYLRGEILEKSIRSALCQSYSGKYEILVINNDPAGVDNEVYDLLCSLADGRISYYVNEKNIGMCGNWNRAIELARAEHIVMLHDDDIIGPYALEAIFRVIDKEPEVQIIGLGNVDFNINGEIPVFKKPDVIICNTITKKEFFLNKCLSIPGLCFKKEFAIKVGGFYDEYYPNEDTIFIYQGVLHGEIVNLNYLLAAYGRGDNETIKGNTLKKIIINAERTRKSIAEHEMFAKFFMRCFGREFLIKYIEEAEKTWNIKIDRDDILKTEGYPSSDKDKLLYMLMKILIKIWSIVEKNINEKKLIISMASEERTK